MQVIDNAISDYTNDKAYSRVGRLYLYLARKLQSVIYLNPQIPNRIFDTLMAEQQLDCSEVASLPVQDRRFGAPKGMGGVK